MELAGRWRRVGGALVDGIVAMVVLYPLVVWLGRVFALDYREALPVRVRIAFVAIGWVVFIVLNGYLLWKRGQTIGKFAVRTRIATMDGGVPPLTKTLGIRYIVVGLLFHVPVLGFLFGLANLLFIFGASRRCLHDYMAGTRVVRA
jgi:uncharacterized RDD family membrane protein YckC